ncbi:MAG: methyltransferase domain-containing protein, partial [Gemmatimonadetes bacterium]|nr:methyltransferase domain-containing protein [Gemmatimonadota bacterium]
MTQQWDPEQYERDGGFVSDYGREVVGILNPQPGERILDLGCGDGRLSEFIVSFGWRLVAIDSRPGQISAAPERQMQAGG